MSVINFRNYEFNEIKNTLNNLKQFLWKHEYTAGYYQRLSEGYSFIHAPRKRLPHANPHTELLLSFFAENRAIYEDELNNIFKPRLKESLEQSKLIVRTNKGKFLSVFRILPLNQYFILIPFRRYCEPQVYIGAESPVFQKYIRVIKHPKKMLDLATGSGYQLFGMPWQGPSYSMLGIDLNPNAIASATLSAKWNNCDWMTFKEGDITKELNEMSEKFDIITGHLPILPTAENTRYKGTMHNDGGTDGFAVIRKILPFISEILSPQGTLQMILISLGCEDQPSLLPEIKTLFVDNGLKGRVIAIKKIPVELDAYYRGKKSEEYNNWMKFYKDQKKTYWYRLILRAEKFSDISKNKDPLKYIELFRYDFSKPPAFLLSENIRRNMNHYLTDIKSLSTVSEENFDKISKKLEREITKAVNQEISITDYGKELAEKFQELFPNSGSAIRFWGKIATDQWQPKYLERKLW
ncbi:MAG: methyltransferase domain-containing protein [Candidatus Kariarchaeaceae archaeon]|jgi:methylase of polypeptide subunit release factors